MTLPFAKEEDVGQAGVLLIY